jgi:type IV pilus assembly protein PilA
MLELLRRKREDDDAGFTLIELMVVVLIIAILIAIAIPTFLGAQNRARDRAAQSDIRNALTAAKTVATDAEGYFCASTPCASGTKITAGTLKAVEGSLSFVDATTAPAAGNTDVAVNAEDDGTSIQFARRSASGTIFGLVAKQDGSIVYCKGSMPTSAATGCTSKW